MTQAIYVIQEMPAVIFVISLHYPIISVRGLLNRQENYCPCLTDKESKERVTHGVSQQSYFTALIT